MPCDDGAFTGKQRVGTSNQALIRVVRLGELRTVGEGGSVSTATIGGDLQGTARDLSRPYGLPSRWCA